MKAKPYNKAAFSRIAVEEQAYWLGFLAADGSVPGRRSVTVHLAKRDRPHLCRLRTFLESRHTVSNRRDGSVSLSFCGRQIANDLYALGVRTGEARFVPILPARLRRHYFRGLFDGDGCIGRTARGYWYMTLVTGEYLCNAFAECAKAVTTSKARTFYRLGTWRYAIMGDRKVWQQAAWLYRNATIFLPRKQRKFLEMEAALV